MRLQTEALLLLQRSLGRSAMLRLAVCLGLVLLEAGPVRPSSIGTLQNLPISQIENCDSKTHVQIFSDVLDSKRSSDWKLKDRDIRTKWVQMGVKFENFYHVNEIYGTIKAHLEMIAVWNDPRLKFSCGKSWNQSVLLLEEEVFGRSVWMPPVTVTTALSSQRPRAPNRLCIVKVHHDGGVHQVMTLIVQSSCTLDLSRFPFDEMLCDFHLSIPSEPSSSLHLSWLPHKPVLISTQHNHLSSHSVESCSVNRTVEVIDEFTLTLLTCVLRFRRHYAYYILQAYIPNIITVLVAWLSFLLCPETAVPARVTLSISSLIAMVLQYGNVAQNIPKVGYLRSFDVWMISCVCFVFFTITQFALSSQIRRTRLQGWKEGIFEELLKKGETKARAEEIAACRQNRTDKVCSYTYLVAFASFCLVYFVGVLCF